MTVKSHFTSAKHTPTLACRVRVCYIGPWLHINAPFVAGSERFPLGLAVLPALDVASRNGEQRTPKRPGHRRLAGIRNSEPTAETSLTRGGGASGILRATRLATSSGFFGY